MARELGNETDAHQYYKEALDEVRKATKLKPHHPDSHFHAGIVQYKLGAYRKAYEKFRSYPEEGENYSEAIRNVKRIKELLRDERRLQRGGIYGGIVIGGVSTILVSILWYAYFFTDKVTETMLTVMSPILLGLVVVAFLLPALIRLKLPGLEAELSQPQESVSSGPKGEVGFGSSQPTISSGPR